MHICTMYRVVGPKRAILLYAADHEFNAIDIHKDEGTLTVPCLPDMDNLPKELTCYVAEITQEVLHEAFMKLEEEEAAIRAQEDAETFEDW